MSAPPSGRSSPKSTEPTTQPNFMNTLHKRGEYSRGSLAVARPAPSGNSKFASLQIHQKNIMKASGQSNDPNANLHLRTSPCGRSEKGPQGVNTHPRPMTP